MIYGMNQQGPRGQQYMGPSEQGLLGPMDPRSRQGSTFVPPYLVHSGSPRTRSPPPDERRSEPGSANNRCDEPRTSRRDGWPVLPPLEQHTARNRASAKSDSSSTSSMVSASPRGLRSHDTSGVSNDLNTDRAFPPRAPGSLDSPAASIRLVSKVDGVVADYPFKPSELRENELPLWDILSEAIDYYYKFMQSNHQILSNRALFLKRLSLNSDSSILHALVATVCSKRQWPFETDEEYWIGKVYKFWDNLNDFGMFVCYSLMRCTNSVKNNFNRLVEFSDRIYEIIHNNRYLEILQNNSNLNARKMYERETIIRMIWKYWMDNLILFRLRQGSPYRKLFMMLASNVFLNSEMANFPNSQLPFPLLNKAHLRFEGSRRLSWDDLGKGTYDDYSSVIKSVLMLEIVMNKISSGALTKETMTFDHQFKGYLESKVLLVKDGVILLNSYFILANCIFHHATILQRSFFLKDVLTFEVMMSLTKSTQPPGHSEYIPLLNGLSMNDLINFEELPNNITAMDEFQWRCLVELIESTLRILELIDVGLGHDPSHKNAEYPVLYGVASMEGPREWYSSNEFISIGRETWLKFCDSVLHSACLLVCIIPSLMILRKSVEISVHGNGVRVTWTKSNTAKDFQIAVSPQHVELFDMDNLMGSFTWVLEFIRFKTEYDGCRIIHQDTTTNINKVAHYIDEILHNIK